MPAPDLTAEYARIRVPARIVALFTRQLSAMLLSGVPLLNALTTLKVQDESPEFGRVVEVCADMIAGGHRFSHAVSRFPKVFSPVYQSMLNIGEQVGQLDDSLERLATWLEKDDELRRKIMSALSYPCLILTVAALLTLGLFYTVMPGFLEIFQDMQIELPLVTRIVLGFTEAVRSPGFWLLLLAGLGFGYSAFQAVMASPSRRVAAYSLMLRVPLLGRMLRAGSLSRFATASATMLNTGMDLARALQLSAAASGSPLLEVAGPRLMASIRDGEMLSTTMAAEPEIYPSLLTQMVAAGEEASCLPEMLERAGTTYEQETVFLVDALGVAIEPLLLGCVAIVIGTIVLSVFLPLYSQIGNIGS